MRINKKKLVSLMIDSNMNNNQLSEASGVCKTRVSLIKNGHNTTYETICKIASALGASVNELIEDDKHNERKFELIEDDKHNERKFEEIVVEYPPAELCTYPKYRGKAYFSIKYEENGKHIIGFGTYNPEVLSRYLREYFITPIS